MGKAAGLGTGLNDGVPQLLRAGDLSPSQVPSRLAALKDRAAEKGWPPLAWNRATGYQLGAERDVLDGTARHPPTPHP